MKWKDWPIWLKFGILLSLSILTLFLIGGIISLIINGGKCVTPPCSAGSGYCPSTAGGCFKIYNNKMYLFLDFPARILFYSIPVMSTIYNYLNNEVFFILPVSIAGDESEFPNIIVNLVLYFIIGAITGFIIEKTYKSKKSLKTKFKK